MKKINSSKNKQEKIAKKHKEVVEDIKVKKATDVRQSFQEVIDNVHYTKNALIISKHKKPWVKIIPLTE